MNKRIRELAEQAGGYLSLSYEHDGKLILSGEDIVQKFAELIIQECARTVAMFSIDKNDIHPDVKWDDMTDSAKMINHTTCQQVASKIKEHFGVE